MIKKNIAIALASFLMLTTAQAKSEYGTVNGVEITKTDVQMTMGPSGISFDVLDANTKKRVLDMVVDRILLAQAAKKTDIAKSEEYKKQLEELKSGLLLDIWMKQMMSKIKKDLSTETLKAYYEKNKSKYNTPKQLKARHILVKTEDEAKALIKELNEAKDKKAKFIELAKSKSTGPSGANGGDLGWFPLDRMVPEFSAAADKLKKGEFTTTPVKTQFGYHVIMLDDRKEAGIKKFEEVEDTIREELGNEEFGKKVQDLTKELRSKAKIELK